MITGLSPTTSGLAFSGNDIFVALPGRVEQYNITTGAINPNFITGSGLGVIASQGLAVSGNNIFASGSFIGKYDGTTGTWNPNFITSTTGLIAASGNTLFVVSSINNAISEYDATTGVQTKPNLITGLSNITGIAASTEIATRPHPVNFQRFHVEDEQGVMNTEYTLKSSSGNLADIADCKVGELVMYESGFGSGCMTQGSISYADCTQAEPQMPVSCFIWPTPPWLRATPNPTVIWLPATQQIPTNQFRDMTNTGSLIDLQKPAPTVSVESLTPGTTYTFTAYQTFRFCCPGLGVVNFPGFENIPITRTISQTRKGCWQYKITKQLKSVVYDLPDQGPPCKPPGPINYGTD